MGNSTAESTKAIPTSAPWICPIDLRVASLGDRCSSAITRSTFSTTTIASSTSNPIARIMPNMVKVLIEKPAAARTPKVPNNTTGTVKVVMMVARRFCKNSSMTRKTRTTASPSVCITPLMDSVTTGVVSYGYTASIPAGKNGFRRSTVARIALAVSRALAPVAKRMAIPEAGLPLAWALML
ncbi:hypothetical protein D3C75_843300 [compost metagenome]